MRTVVPRLLKQPGAWDSPLDCLTKLVWGGRWIFKSSPGDSNVEPGLRTTESAIVTAPPLLIQGASGLQKQGKMLRSWRPS